MTDDLILNDKEREFIRREFRALLNEGDGNDCFHEFTHRDR